MGYRRKYCMAREYDKEAGTHSEYQCDKGLGHNGDHGAKTGELVISDRGTPVHRLYQWSRANPY